MNVGTNVIWGVVESVFRIGATFFVNIFIARSLGPADYGTLSAAFVTINLFSAFAELGLDVVIVRELASERKANQEILGSAYRLRAVAAGLSCVTLLLLAAFSEKSIFGSESYYWQAALVMAFLIPFQPYALTVGGCFQAFLEAKQLTAAKTSGLALATICRIAGLIFQLPLVYYALCHVIEHLFATIVGRIRYKHRIEKRVGEWRYNRKIAIQLLKDVKWLFLSAILVHAISGIGVILLKLFSSPEETGHFSAALRLVIVTQFFPAILCRTFLPVIMRRFVVDDPEGVQLERELLRGLWAYGYITASIFFFSADWIIVLLLGEGFEGAAEPLKVLAIMLIPASVGAARRVLFVKTEKYGKILFSDVSAVTLSLVGGALLIEPFGATGVAIASLVSSVVGYLLIPYLGDKHGRSMSGLVFGAALYPFPNIKRLFNATLIKKPNDA